jgi:glycosyltransferase involved in cell wall biosynthesis
MKILWICPFLPFPPDNGLRIREHNLITRISQDHEVHLFTLIQSTDEMQNVAEFRKQVTSLTAVLPDEKKPGSLDQRRTISDVYLGIFDKRPRRFYGNVSRNVISALRELYNANDYDLMIVEALCMTNYVWDLLPLHKFPAVLVEHNIESDIQKLVWQTSSGFVTRMRKWLYYETFKGFEINACKHFDKIVCVSEKDRDCLAQTLSANEHSVSIDIVPNGVDLTIGAGLQIIPEPDTLIYSGALTYNANYDAVAYFLREIFPLIQEKHPRVRLFITGATDGVDLNALPKNDAVIFTGYVADIHSMIKSKWVSIVPLRIGGGTRLKILEAIVLGTPVVSTSKGAEGLNITPGNGCLIADQPAEFAQAVLHLLENAATRAQVGQAGMEEIRTRYDWNLIATDMQKFLHQFTLK